MTKPHGPDLELMAATLNSHEDYRVLRRFRPERQLTKAEVPGDRLKIGLILDTETTGRDPATDKIVELGLVSFTYDQETGEPVEIIDVYNSLEDPGIPISEEASRVNGITDEMVQGHRINDGKVRFVAERAELVIAHNSQFDRDFCERRFPFFRDIKWACSRTQIDWAAEEITGQKQDYIAFRLGFFYEAHRAQEDCLALLKILSTPLPVSGKPGLKLLLDAYDHKELRLWALDSPFERKDMLSARGYRWGDGKDGKEKAWYTTLPEDKLEEELAWLKANIYRRPGRVVLDDVDARCRFSPRRLGTRMQHFE